MEPDDTRRALPRQGTRGTVVGEFWRTIMQLESLPLAYVHRASGGRRWVRGDRPQGMGYGWGRQSPADALAQDMGGLVGYTLSAMTCGYAAMILKDIAKGRKPRDPRKMETWLKAAVQSGGVGIYGDFFWGKVNGFDNAPSINLWYTRAALEWTLLYHVREWMRPGVLNRLERTMKTG